MEVTTVPPLGAFELWRQVKRQLCGGIQTQLRLRSFPPYCIHTYMWESESSIQ